MSLYPWNIYLYVQQLCRCMFETGSSVSISWLWARSKSGNFSCVKPPRQVQDIFSHNLFLPSVMRNLYISEICSKVTCFFTMTLTTIYAQCSTFLVFLFLFIQPSSHDKSELGREQGRTKNYVLHWLILSLSHQFCSELCYRRHYSGIRDHYFNNKR